MIVNNERTYAFNFSEKTLKLFVSKTHRGYFVIKSTVEIFVKKVDFEFNCKKLGEVAIWGMILQEFNRENVFSHKINIINQFMIRKNVNNDLQRRVREYLRFIWKEENT